MTQVFRELSETDLAELDRRAQEQGVIHETGESIPPVQYSRAVGSYQAPTVEQFNQHDVNKRGESIIPVRSVKLIVRYVLDEEGHILAERSEDERERVADQLTLYQDGPSISGKTNLQAFRSWLDIKVRVIGGFEFILPPFLDKNTQQMKHDAKVQKLHVTALEGKNEGQTVMLRFGAESAGLFLAKWTAAYRDFDFPEGKYVDVRITQEGNNLYRFERV